ncbi:hypothetical protein P4B35_10785 [Pontiellaceae bacterium B12227]|nr:hypothetical protein [Pontiellaceae bacterium B12227]
MKLSLAFLGCICAVCAEASILLQDSFEGLLPGSVDQQNNWVVDYGSGNVQSNTVYDGEQALDLQSGSVSHSISNSESSVWIRFQTLVSGAPETNPAAGDSTGIAFFVNTNLTLTVYSNTVPVDLGIPVPTNVWTRFDVYCEYESSTWNLSMNGTTVAAALPFYSDLARFEEVMIANEGLDSVYIDEIDIRDEELAALAPDLDGDAMPDWWEQKYSGSITGLVAHGESGNPGWSFLETYVAGISPEAAEPFTFVYDGFHSLSWDAKPSRAYAVLWTTNLVDGFTPVASNLVGQSYFTDTGPNATLPSGFYRLEVQVAP